MTKQLISKILDQSSVKAALISDSALFKPETVTPTFVPILNVALSGSLTGGLTSGILQIAGPSKHFKTLFGLVMVKAFLDKHKDGVCVFYDSEFGAGTSYFENMGIDISRVIHKPIANVEELKFDITKLLDSLSREDKVVLFTDSIGNLASKKEVEDAKEEKSVADMSRAKALKSLGRIVTPVLRIKDIPWIAINHTYQSLSFIPKTEIGGGTGMYYSSDNIWIVSRKQEAEEKTVVGYQFTINVEKSRFVKEKSKFALEVSWEDGINKWSGLLNEALEAGIVTAPSKGYYSLKDSTTKYREKDIPKEFWGQLIMNKEFRSFIENKYRIEGALVSEE